MTYNHAYMREKRKMTTQPEALLRFSRDYARFFMHSNYYYCCCSSVMLRAAHFINVIRKRKVCVVCMVHLITISSSSKMKMNHSRCAIATAQSKTTF